MLTDEQLTERIIYAIIRVHQTLGPGFLESIYRSALAIELTKQRLSTEQEKRVFVHYEGQIVGRHRLDLIVENRIVLELKSVDALSKAHYAQIRSYTKATDLTLGLLVNFATPKADFRRISSSPLPPHPP